jgi:hypothetical protein
MVPIGGGTTLAIAKPVTYDESLRVKAHDRPSGHPPNDSERFYIPIHERMRSHNRSTPNTNTR